MSRRRRPNPSEVVSAALTRRAIARAELLSRSELYAASINAIIDVQAVLGREHEWNRRVLAHAVGRRTEAERRERRERRLRAERRSAAGVDRHRSGHAPVAFWHEGGDGPVLLLLNGWGASGLSWPSALVRRLEERFRVVRVDNRGSGYSRTAPAPFTLADLADDAAAVVRAVGAGRAVVVGMSMGGMIAQELALRHAGLVDRLVLVASRPPAPASIHAAEAVMRRTFEAPAPSQALEEFLWAGWASMCAPGFAVREPALIDELVEQSTARLTPRAGVRHQMRAMAAWRGANRLQDIRAPTTVVHGVVDPLSPVGNGMRLAQLIPGARYIELAHVGHLVPVEAGEQLAEILAND